MSDPPQHVSSREWKLSAALVGVLAVFIASWAVEALDINGVAYFAAWLVIAVGSVGIATVLLVPRASSQRRGRSTRGAARR